MITPENIKKNKIWSLPKPKGNYKSTTISSSSDHRFTQQRFYDEYYPTGHKIYSHLHFPDIPILNKAGRPIEYHKVNRISIPLQKMSIDICLAHLLGNQTAFMDTTVGENKQELMSQYKDFWNAKNMEVLRNSLIKSILSVGDGAALFYKDGKELKWKVFSFLEGDEIYEVKDKYGETSHFGRFYTILDEDGETKNYCDIYDKDYCETFVNDGAWSSFDKQLHGFKKVPVVYYCRREGAFWTPAQENIENLEIMLSRLSEDNRTKTKARYHLKTDDPKSVQTSSAGGTDIVITGVDGDFKLLSGADISTQFKFEFESLFEIISNVLGMVFPKSKSSGDMPTGSMKMMFYPTERIVLQLIHEFNGLVEKINSLFKEGMTFEHTELASELTKLNVSASIKMFTPQDDAATANWLGQALTYGSLSKQTVAETMPNAASDEFNRLEAQEAAAQAALDLSVNKDTIPAKAKTKTDNQKPTK